MTRWGVAFALLAAAFVVACSDTPAPAVPTPAPAVTATARPTQADPAATTSPQVSDCHPSYPTVCIPPPPPDLDCGEITERRFAVVGSDPHGFDGDSDGIGCER